VKEAGSRYDRGLQLYSDGDYALAVIEFERAYSLVSDYRVLYNIGQVRVQLGNYAKARLALEQYLKTGGEQVPKARQDSVHKDLEMLIARTAFLRVETNVPGADVAIDDVSVGTAPLSEPLLLEAGEHKVTVQRSGYQPRATRLTLAGRDEENVRLDLEKVQGPAAPIIVETVKPQESDRSTWLWATWSATGAFALGAAATGGLGIKAANDLDQLRSDPTATRGELDSASRRARTLLTTADVLGGLAIATGGVAIYLTLSGPSAEPGKEKPKSGAGSVSLMARPGWVGVNGRF
jgi:tetratricopeptide (TPR) repeat protein